MQTYALFYQICAKRQAECISLHLSNETGIISSFYTSEMSILHLSRRLIIQEDVLDRRQDAPHLQTDQRVRSIIFDCRRRQRHVLGRNFLIVTAGLGLDEKNNFKLSYAFEAILQWMMSRLCENDIITIPPAPSYGAKHRDGRKKYEGDFAEEYLISRRVPSHQLRILSNHGEHYMDGDTRGNAEGIRKAERQGLLLPDAETILVVYFLQALRALTVFTQEGVHIDRVVGIQPLNIPERDKVMVPELPYYDRWTHPFYEAAAFFLFLTRLDRLLKELKPGLRGE